MHSNRFFKKGMSDHLEKITMKNHTFKILKCGESGNRELKLYEPIANIILPEIFSNNGNTLYMLSLLSTPLLCESFSVYIHSQKIHLESLSFLELLDLLELTLQTNKLKHLKAKLGVQIEFMVRTLGEMILSDAILKCKHRGSQHLMEWFLYILNSRNLSKQKLQELSFPQDILLELVCAKEDNHLSTVFKDVLSEDKVWRQNSHFIFDIFKDEKRCA